MASDATYAVSGLVAVSGFTLQEWFGLGGLALALGTFAVNWYYKSRADARAEAEHRMKMGAQDGVQGTSGE